MRCRRTSISTCSGSSPTSSAIRCRAARSRSIRRPAACSRCTARRASTPIVSSAACRRRTTDSLRHRPASSALQQGDAGHISARLDVEAGDTVDRPRGRAVVTMNERMPIAVHRRTSSTATAISAAGTSAATASLDLAGRDREVVRRLLLPARAQARARASWSPAASTLGFRRADGHRPARGEAAALPERDPNTTTASTAAQLEQSVDAQHGDRAG